MDLVAGVRKEGSRGGRGDFKWEDVKGDQHRENYLGHSLMAPVGRWQKNKDLGWYTKGDGSAEAVEAAAKERREEIARIKEAEADALREALGYKVEKRVAGVGNGANALVVEEGGEMGKMGGMGMNMNARIGGEEDVGVVVEKKGREREEKERRHRRREEGHRAPRSRRDLEMDGHASTRRRHRSRSRSRSYDRHHNGPSANTHRRSGKRGEREGSYERRRDTESRRERETDGSYERRRETERRGSRDEALARRDRERADSYERRRDPDRRRELERRRSRSRSRSRSPRRRGDDKGGRAGGGR
ncbi:hypothetical protein MMC34_005426 [Xylographa carneopallida]|nr:hypothetical protein [Xylographa carneopallida]